MSKPTARSTLYRLIEAGQLAHRAVLAPLLDRNLEPGDDAVIFALHSQPGGTEAELADALSITPELLRPRLERLAERDIVSLADGALMLTERGERLCEALSAHWEQLEAALFAQLEDKQHKKLDKLLRRFVELLRL